MRRERLLLRERLADLSSSFSALFERERLLDFETEEASESSSRAIFAVVLGVSRRRRLRESGESCRAERAVERSCGAVELWSCAC